jgi:hypothetical protein
MSAETLGPHQSSVTVDKQEKIAHMGEQLTQKKNDPRSDYLQKTNEEQVDFIIRGSSAPMEQPQKVAVADSGAGCTRERHMKSTELLLDGIDGLVGCFGFVQDCIHQVCEVGACTDICTHARILWNHISTCNCSLALPTQSCLAILED